MKNKTRKICRKGLQLVSALVVVMGFDLNALVDLNSQNGLAVAAEDSRFENFEIRVIRPRYFAKRRRFELGIDGVIITNQTFIYTYLASLQATYHLSESIGLEGGLTMGGSIDKDDKALLEEEFNIKTQIIRTASIASLAALWSPIYGKYQLSSGRLIYFDTFLVGGVGLSGVDYKFDHCVGSKEDNKVVRADYIAQYPGFTFGIGQRFFLNKKSSFKWNLRNHSMILKPGDGACFEDADADVPTTFHHNLTMQLGYSHFF